MVSSDKEDSMSDDLPNVKYSTQGTPYPPVFKSSYFLFLFSIPATFPFSIRSNYPAKQGFPVKVTM